VGYDLHITRKAFWADDEGPVITLENWAAYVETDLEITLDPENPGTENYVLRCGQHSCPLWWEERGEVCTTNPEPEVIAKLVRVAAALGARVLGDDGEVYGTDPSDPTKPIAL